MEDVSFCLKCRDKDIPIYVHPEVKVIHRKPIHLKLMIIGQTTIGMIMLRISSLIEVELRIYV